MAKKRNGKNRRQNKKRNGKVKVTLPATQGYRVSNINPLQRLRLKNREFIMELTAPVGGTGDMTIIELNPGMSEAFPWLSRIANAFESYTLNRLSFEYVPAVGTSTDGSIFFAVDYDPTDDDSKLSITKLAQFAGSLKAPLWSTKLQLNCPKRDLARRKSYFTRGAGLEQSKRGLFDVGQLIMYLNSSLTAGQYFGDLYVNYDIELQTPQSEPLDTVDVLIIESTPLDPTQPFAEDEFVIQQDVGGDIIRYSDNQLEFLKPGGHYTMSMSGDNATSVTDIADLSVSGGIGATVTKISEVVDLVGEANWAAYWDILVDTVIPATKTIIGWAGLTAAAGGVYAINIAQINDNAALLPA